MSDSTASRLGLALGSGSARGWSHVGVIRALEAAGLKPDVICGASAGAMVGAMYAGGKLDAFEAWGRQLDRRKVVGYFDFSLRGGLIKGRRVFDFVEKELPGQTVESLPKPFAAVATELATGHEVWLREGSLIEALHASMAIPGFVTPVRRNGRWLVDGGLVNPVPVSVCRALGASYVIAVDLNTALLTYFRDAEPAAALAVDAAAPEVSAITPGDEVRVLAQEGSVQSLLRSFTAELRQRFGRDEMPDREPPPPSIYDVLANSINIMQARITRSRMAGDPADLVITPRLPDFGMLDLDRAAEAIELGKRAAEQALASAPPELLPARFQSA